ncbi:hypothetical protein ASE67_02575 [Sphingomonas sp. Leaf23]|uniref:hypothetical protein n=1 Tax=Sphingomonas sp. Leaf23 TaxID=1735689 RepID=UPI0006F87E35|nr:hypothetical protein [Sphingomonas sp. Leaf23]KQM88645.1 hypothetical protein ASE67_02575 [Sphingomonas sp. Leaf23]
MRIVDRATFLAMPAGTLFAKADTPNCYGFGPLTLKGETTGNDFYEQRLIGDVEGADDSERWIQAYDAMVAGEAKAIDLDIEGRDGLFDDDQLFAVFDRSDHINLIKRLIDALDQG